MKQRETAVPVKVAESELGDAPTTSNEAFQEHKSERSHENRETCHTMWGS